MVATEDAMAKQRCFELSVAQPCAESWEAMRKEGRSRFCESCGKVVQDLSRISDRQVQELAMRAAAGEAVCGRVTRRMDGELVTLGPGQTRTAVMAQRALLAGAFAAGLPAVAQGAGQAVQRQDDAEVMLREVPPEPQPIPGKAVVIGRLLHPDGRRVDTGLVYVQNAQGYGPFYVVDASGWFEIHTAPGVYNFVVRTGKDQIERVPGVVLHEGVQQFADIRTRAEEQATEFEETYTFVGEITARVTTRWSWFRHPVVYARYLMRKM
jgi:hypothetical protein